MMKKLIALLIACSQVQAFACTCEEPGYTNLDAEKAAVSFMQNKMRIGESSIQKVETISIEGFLTFLDRRILDYAGAYSNEALACERSCAEAQNNRYKMVVSFLNESGQSCRQELEVTMKSNVMSRGYKSKVKKEIAPKC